MGDGVSNHELRVDITWLRNWPVRSCMYSDGSGSGFHLEESMVLKETLV